MCSPRILRDIVGSRQCDQMDTPEEDLMPSDPSSVECRRCQNDVAGDFCPSCGLPREVPRINGAFLAAEIASLFNFKKGILHTIRELLIAPGASVRKYLLEDRTSLLRPISFLVISSLVYLLAQQLFRFQDGYVSYSDYDWKGSSIPIIMGWISRNYGFANLLMAVFIAAWIKLLFRGHEFNFYEVLVLLYFVMGVEMILFASMGLLESLSGYKILDKESLLVIGYALLGNRPILRGPTSVRLLQGVRRLHAWNDMLSRGRHSRWCVLRFDQRVVMKFS